MILELQEQREARVFKALGVKQVNLVFLEKMALWVHQERMECQEKKVPQEMQDLRGFQGFLEVEVLPDSQGVLDIRGPKEVRAFLARRVTKESRA